MAAPRRDGDAQGRSPPRPPAPGASLAPPQEGCEAAAGPRLPHNRPAPPLRLSHLARGPEQPEEGSAPKAPHGSAPLSASDLIFLYLSRTVPLPPEASGFTPPTPSSARQSVPPAHFLCIRFRAFIFPFSSTPFFVLFRFSSGPLFSSFLSFSPPPCPLILCPFFPLFPPLGPCPLSRHPHFSSFLPSLARILSRFLLPPLRLLPQVLPGVDFAPSLPLPDLPLSPGALPPCQQPLLVPLGR